MVEQTSQPDAGQGDEKPPTLKTIAFMTGLGVTTVSRALKDAPDIGVETKKRVRLVAEQIGYRPNRAGIRLRTGRTQVISLVLDTSEEAGAFITALIYGVSSRIASTPYHLVVTPSFAGHDPMDAVRYVVETGSADGIIISRTEPRDRRVQYLLDRGIPFAAHGRTELGRAHPFVDYDNTRFAMLAIDKLMRKGRRRIGLIGPPPGLTFHGHMWEGFARGVEHAGVSQFPLRGLDMDAPIERIRDEARRIAERGDFPDGVIAASGSAAISFVNGFEAAGLTLGKDFDVVTKETVPLQQLIRGDLMVISEDFRAAGHLLADCVIRAINGVDPSALQIIMTPEED
jgi:LacI family transcriptional regulator